MTAAEREWLDAICRLGCCVCIRTGRGASPAEPHHLLSGGRRIGHRSSIPLCAIHHRTGGNTREWVARHPHRVEFVRRYGSEQELLVWTQERVAMLAKLNELLA